MIYPVQFIAMTNSRTKNNPKLYHSGRCIDFGKLTGHTAYQPVYACESGKVYKIENQEHGGKVLFILHDNGWLSHYAHLETILVKKGDRVNLGQQIAIVGNTGKGSDGEELKPHLHFGVWIDKKYINKKNAKYMVDIIKWLFTRKNDIISNTTNKKVPEILKYGTKKVCNANGVRIRKSPVVSLLNKTGNVLNKKDEVLIYEYAEGSGLGWNRTSATESLWVASKFLE